MKQVLSYLISHGFYVMISGFGISLIGLLVYMQTRYQGSNIPQIAFGATIAGFVVYVLGRIFVAMDKQKRKKQPANDLE